MSDNKIIMEEKQLFQIIRHFLNNESVTGEIDWTSLWPLAKKHSLGQFVSAYMFEPCRATASR